MAWRLAGARTLNTSRFQDRRASYVALGVMLAMQMGLRLLSSLRLAYLALRAQSQSPDMVSISPLTTSSDSNLDLPSRSS